MRQQTAVWFVRRGDSFVELPPDAGGIFRSKRFPGLWLDAAAFFRDDDARVHEVLSAGLKAPDHAQFVARQASQTR